MEAIILLLKEKKEGTEFEIASKSCDLLFTLAAECQKNAFPGPENLRRTLTCIESQLYLPLSVDKMAAFCKVSPATLTRLFRKYLQCTPMEYLLQKRMKHARDLLRTTELSIKEISVRCGIPDQLYFSTVFKKIVENLHVSTGRNSTENGAFSVKTDRLIVCGPPGLRLSRFYLPPGNRELPGNMCFSMN